MIPYVLAGAVLGAIATLPAVAQLRPDNPSDTVASGLLDIARTDLAAGRTDAAQRALEQLVANFPETRSAAEARRSLYLIYSRIVVPDRPALTSQPTDTPPATSGERSTAPAKTSSWRTSVISDRRLQDELRNTLGDRLFFSVGSADLGARGRVLVAAQAEWLRQRPDIDIVVEGHADDTNGGVDNEEISTRRAAVVRDGLVGEGVAAARIRMSPRGNRDPIAICEDSACAAQNRRVVLQLALRGQQVLEDAAVPVVLTGRPEQSQR